MTAIEIAILFSRELLTTSVGGAVEAFLIGCVRAPADKPGLY